MGQKHGFKLHFIGIGTRRSGTSWVAQCLREHPQICMSRVKETFFFCDFLVSRKKRDINVYKKYFSHCQAGQIAGEFTPHYFFGKNSAREIKQYFPDAKLILCLRNPAERLYSLYFFWKYRGRHKFETFEEFIEKENLDAKNEGLYHTHLMEFYKYFPKKNILVMIYEDIEKDPTLYMRKILKFIGADLKIIPSSVGTRVNSGKKHKGWFVSAFLYRIIGFINRYDLGRKLIDRLMDSYVRVIFDYFMIRGSDKRNVNEGRTRRPAMIHATRRKIMNYYESEINNLEKTLDRDLSFWR